MPAPRPALRADLPNVGDTVWVVSCFKVTGSEPNCRAMASDWADAWVKLPEICTEPSKDDHTSALGWVIGADCTTPSSSMPMISWKYFWVMVSQPVDPALVSAMLTTHWPV